MQRLKDMEPLRYLIAEADDYFRSRLMGCSALWILVASLQATILWK